MLTERTHTPGSSAIREAGPKSAVTAPWGSGLVNGPETGWGEMSYLKVSIGTDLPEADFRPRITSGWPVIRPIAKGGKLYAFPSSTAAQ